MEQRAESKTFKHKAMNVLTDTKTRTKNQTIAAIRNLGIKWNFKDLVASKIVHRSCATKYRSWITSLEGIAFALLCFILSPYLIGYACIFINNNCSVHASTTAILREEKCVMKNSKHAPLILSPPNNCQSVCHGIDKIASYNMQEITSKKLFDKFAYGGRPVLLRDVASNWPSNKIFNFTFLKDLFLPLYDKISKDWELTGDGFSDERLRQLYECQFLPFNTDFDSILDFFNMSESRAALNTSEPSYFIAFNNCFRKEINVRQFLGPLAFLPADSESKQADWIFIGGSAAGKPTSGSPIHIDEVLRPSWHAVLSGGYSWIISPPAECESQCAGKFEVEMNQGDVLIMDTNIWQYETKAKSGMLTVVYGSEFD